MLSDKIFWYVIVLAIPFWCGLFFYTKPQFSPFWPLNNPVAFVIPALIYPVLEEVVFRGLLQDFLQRRLKPGKFGPITIANILTSIVFAAMHFFYHSPLWAAAVFIPSLLFGYFKDRYLSLGPPILLHVYYNSGYYWIFSAVSE